MFDVNSEKVVLAESRMLDEEYRIWMWIRGCEGKSSALNAGKLAALEDMTRRKARRIVKVLVERYDLPIASSIVGSSTGYYIPKTEEERNEYIQVLNSNIRGNARRLRAFDKNSAQAHLDVIEQTEHQLSIV